MIRHQNTYQPDIVTLPGETLNDLLEERGMSQKELAQRMNRPEKTISEIIKGKAAITPDTAVQLETVLRVPAHFWIQRESLYQEHLARVKDIEQLNESTTWLNTLPLNQMIKYGWIQKQKNKVDQLKEVLNYFGVASVNAWESLWIGTNSKVSFRISRFFTNENAAIASWLRHGEVRIQNADISPYDEKKFKDNLHKIKELTVKRQETFKSEIKRLCSESGVHVIFSPPIQKATISGAVRWVGNHPLIQLTVRGKHNDKFWFTFFHEAAHILLHGKKEFFLEGTEQPISELQKEIEANDYATDFLIPREQFKAFVEKKDFSPTAIIRFAKTIGIHSAIVVGQLQKLEYIPYSHLADMKQRLNFEMD
jgi:HTH-type transcriptional regulator / antitoxin HigA